MTLVVHHTVTMTRGQLQATLAWTRRTIVVCGRDNVDPSWIAFESHLQAILVGQDLSGPSSPPQLPVAALHKPIGPEVTRSARARRLLFKLLAALAECRAVLAAILPDSTQPVPKAEESARWAPPPITPEIRHRYAGKWIALKGTKVVAAVDEYGELPLSEGAALAISRVPGRPAEQPPEQGDR